MIIYDRYILSGREVFTYILEGVSIAALISYVYYRSLLVFLFLMPFGICYPWYKKKNLKKRRSEKLSVEFKEGITVLSASLVAGYSVENAFRVSVDELKLLYGDESMIVREFQYITGQIGMNRPVEDVYKRQEPR